MGTGAKQQAQPTNQTITQTNLPAYAQPYVTDVLKRGQAVSNQQYTPYEGQRIAGFTPLQEQAQAGVAGLQNPWQFGSASDMALQGGLGSLSAGQYNPAQFNSATVGTGSFTDPGVAAQYMSPYMQNVLDVQKQEALRDAQQGQLAQNLGASRTGTYGGARQLLATTERERNLADQMGQIQATGMQSSYEAAQRGYESDQGRSLQAQMANQQSGLEAQRLAEQSRQFGGNLGLQGYAQALQGAETLGGLGSTQQQGDLQRLQAQSMVGQEQQGLDQQRLDTAYADFLRQRDYPMEMLGYYSNLIQGTPMAMGSTSTTYAPPPSTMAQVGGLGLAGLGLYNMSR